MVPKHAVAKISVAVLVKTFWKWSRTFVPSTRVSVKVSPAESVKTRLPTVAPVWPNAELISAYTVVISG